ALVIDVDQTDQMSDFVAGWIDPLVLAQETNSGHAESMNFLLLLGRDFALEPDESFFGRQPLAYFSTIKIRQGRREQFDRFVLVDDPARLAEQAWRLYVGGEYFAVAIDDIRSCGGDSVLRRAAAGAVTIANHGKHDQPPADHGVDWREVPEGKRKP